MLQSMTGYGRATQIFFNKKVTVEIRSLNSKGVDIYLKCPNSYKPFELPIRKTLTDALGRGKIECYITEEPMEGKVEVSINTDLIRAYYKELAPIIQEMGDSSDILATVLRLPEVLQAPEQEISDEEWNKVQELISEALVNINNFRTQEGKTLISDFNNCVGNIEKLLLQVPQYENVRIEMVKDRMQKGLEKLQENFDQNRFEQELIYYIEKLDISEEKTRLQHHIDYFKETMNLQESSGKKLGFITQEMGREINTLGSKSYHAELQKIVVEMKDNLEKIKEQVANTL